MFRSPIAPTLGSSTISCRLDSSAPSFRSPAALVVPELVAYRPLAVALGVLGAWLFALVTASFWVRKQIGAHLWRQLH